MFEPDGAGDPDDGRDPRRDGWAGFGMSPDADDHVTGERYGTPQYAGLEWGLDAAFAAHLRRLLDAEPGAVLAAAAEDAIGAGGVLDLSHDGVVALAAAAQRLLGWAMSVHCEASAELARRMERTVEGSEGAVAEIALASGVSEHVAWNRADAGTAMPVRFPAIWAALRNGRVEWGKASLILGKTAHLTPTQAATLEPGALAAALRMTMPKLRRWVDKAITDLDPEAAAERAAAAHRNRYVSTRPGPDGTAIMSVTASAAEIAAAEAALNRIHARLTARPDGDADSDGLVDDGDVDPLRDAHATRVDIILDVIHHADTCDPATSPYTDGGCDCLTRRGTGDETSEDETSDAAGQDAAGESAAPPAAADDAAPPATAATRTRTRSRTQRRRTPQRGRTEVTLTMPLSTMLGLNDATCELGGYGPIPAAMAREIATTGIWKCAVTDDRPGMPHATLLGLGTSTYSPGYTPTTAARHFTVAREGLCVFPGCRRPARPPGPGYPDDLDHRIPWSDPDDPDDPDGAGGVTCECNLEPLCRRHHRLKHSGFDVTIDRLGALTWTTPRGRVYEQPPTALPHAPMPTPDLVTASASASASAVFPSPPADDEPPPF